MQFSRQTGFCFLSSTARQARGEQREADYTPSLARSGLEAEDPCPAYTHALPIPPENLTW